MEPLFVHPDIAEAQTLPAVFYTADIYYGASLQKIFAPMWLYVGDAATLAEPGAIQPFVWLPNYGNEPLVLANDGGTLRCMSNVCTHRANLLVTEPCRLHHIRCGYHGRQFSLAGKMLHMPEFKEVRHFPCPADDLHQLPLMQWGNLLFTSVGAGIPFQTVFAEMQARISWYPMDKLQRRPDLSKDYEVAANWALYCENYLEGFHIPFVHAGLNKELDFGEYSTELFRYSNLQLGIGKDDDVCFDLPTTSPDYGKKVAAYYFWVFPNMMFNFYPWGLSLNVVYPTGPSSCKVSFIAWVLHEELLGEWAGSGLDEVELEDEAIEQQVQQGVRSRFYQHGRYSVLHEQGTHHFHRLICAFMNATENTPA